MPIGVCGSALRICIGHVSMETMMMMVDSWLGSDRQRKHFKRRSPDKSLTLLDVERYPYLLVTPIEQCNMLLIYFPKIVVASITILGLGLFEEKKCGDLIRPYHI
jgi:hypothetical protein